MCTRKLRAESKLASLNALLSSSRPDDSISEELVEMLGFDEIELSMDILSSRNELSQEVAFLYQYRYRSILTVIADIAILSWQFKFFPCCHPQCFYEI
jgi:hypothetical protein